MEYQLLSKKALLQLQKGLFLLLQKDGIRAQKELYQSEVAPWIPKALSEADPILQDLLDLEKILNPPRQKTVTFEGWTVVETDDPEDLLLCGTEVDGSCQSIHREGTNKCLLGYVLDGKNRLVAVKNKDGEIVARCILKMLWDEERPVLLQERVYLKFSVDDKVKKALANLCRAKAERLGIPLVASAEDANSSLASYPKSLSSLGCRAPFEYSDAGWLGMTNGQFIIHGVKILFKGKEL